MLVKIKGLGEFQPVTLEITFENADEVVDMWHRVNISTEMLRKSYGVDVNDYFIPSNDTASLWNRLERLVRKLGLKPTVRH